MDNLASNILELNSDCYDKDGYVNIVEIIKHMGFVVGESSKLDPLEDGFISVSQDKTDVVIGVNKDRTFSEKRFCAAHELGHYYLHYLNEDLDGTVMHRESRKGKNQKENEADFFAACLLMPYDNFKSKYEAFKELGLPNKVIEQSLQRIFKVPLESVQRRIEEVQQ